MSNRWRRFLAMMLSVVLCMSLLSGTTFASEMDADMVMGNIAEEAEVNEEAEEADDAEFVEEEIPDNEQPENPEEDTLEESVTEAALWDALGKSSIMSELT